MLKFNLLVIVVGLGVSSSWALGPAFTVNVEEHPWPGEPPVNTNTNCSCSSPLLCMSIADAMKINASTPHVQKFLAKLQKSQVFAFVLKCDPSVWGRFNWSKLTTVALVGFYDTDLLCHAHEHGVQVVKLSNFPTSDLPNRTARQNWIKLQATDIALKFLDGINIDYEDAVDPDSPQQVGLTNLVRETSEMLHSQGSQVSFDVAWSAKGTDGRHYDYQAIANYSDLIFIMAYDEQSQFDPPCTARPNSGIYMTAKGLQTYLDLGIPSKKMILGVPWYGYDYPCVTLYANDTCSIKKWSFRGSVCSDAVGKQYPYTNLVKTRKKYHAKYRWDKESLTPWYDYYMPKGNEDKAHQVRYDDELSLGYKYMLAVMSGLRGVGMWTANFLDYSDTPEGAMERQAMWSSLP